MLLLCVGAVLTGIGLSHAQNYRFGVVLCVPDPANHPIAISWVLAGGVAGAVIGPEYAKHTHELTKSPFAGVFLLAAACFGLVFAVLLCSTAPLRNLTESPAAEVRIASGEAGLPRRPLRAVFAQPRCAAAVVVGAFSYAVMVFLMAAVPLAIKQVGFNFVQSSTVVQVHMVSMFAPSFVTGHLVRLLGAPALELLGAALIAAGAGVMLWRRGALAAFAASQALVGCGWNLCFVSATATLQQQTRPAERVGAQAANDLAVFGLSGCASLLAAIALSEAGWAGMQLAAFGTSGAIVLTVGVSEVLARRTAVGEALVTPAAVKLELKIASESGSVSDSTPSRDGVVVVESEALQG